MSPGRNVGSSATGVVTRPKVCVRLCDGRYFPVQRHSGVGSAKSCSSFCPASATKIYNGNSINHAVALDGKRYSELPARLCSGRGSSLAAPLHLQWPADQTATTFTPISSYAGLSADLRRQLTETKIEPAAEGPAPLPPVRQAEATSGRNIKNKRAQVDR